MSYKIRGQNILILIASRFNVFENERFFLDCTHCLLALETCLDNDLHDDHILELVEYAYSVIIKQQVLEGTLKPELECVGNILIVAILYCSDSDSDMDKLPKYFMGVSDE
ncbi:hypothetical protein Q4489_03780 [Thalassotalea sp. 1_MG-2023]|uniref:hypothetical protein n=1 Tax=Thalassotalea sp. 1_MG-2023 TaxID=3062680 RepID=UPI0026E31AD3|nr:hypothetical protein [Thalassotalea sp. 1_MG-2023]MDO6426115.1 hypothetical protein [Thalassotalea sp. 1_MG-2023]